MTVPKQVIVETTGACNLSCPGCYREQGDHASTHMDQELFESIIRELATWGPKPEIIPFCHGEPLMDPHFYERLRFIESYGLKWKFCTNGTIANWKVFDLALKSDLCQSILFSIDGWSPRTIAETRGIEALLAPHILTTLLTRHSKQKPWLGVRMRRVSQDYAEVEDFIRGWLLAGADMVLVCRNVEQAARSVLETNPRCHYLEGRTAVIFNNGSLHICDRRVPTWAWGRLEGESYLELWNRAREKELRKPHCRTCPQRYNGEGFHGELWPRGDLAGVVGPIYYHEDQFQSVYSLRDEKKGISWK